jgi:hypothetical protein
MRKALNYLLARLGYRIERISPFKHRLQELLAKKEHLKFVQIGAHDGIRFDGLYDFVTQHRCEGIVVEPLPDIWERLRFNYELLALHNCLDADFIQIDTEGFDIPILQMIDFKKFLPQLIKYEHKNASKEARASAE